MTRMNVSIAWTLPITVLLGTGCEDVEPLSVTNEEACRGVRFDSDDPEVVGDAVPWVRAAHVEGQVGQTDLDVAVCVTQNPADPTDPLPLLASAASGDARFHMELMRTPALAEYPAGDHPIHDLLDDDVPDRAFGVFMLVCRPSDFPNNVFGGRQCDEPNQTRDGEVVIRDDGPSRTFQVKPRYTEQGESQSLELTILVDAELFADDVEP
jgi:hypothetical protein